MLFFLLSQTYSFPSVFDGLILYKFYVWSIFCWITGGWGRLYVLHWGWRGAGDRQEPGKFMWSQDTPPKKNRNFLQLYFNICHSLLHKISFSVWLFDIITIFICFFSASVSISLQYLYKQLGCLCFQDLQLFLIATQTHAK